MRFQFTPNVIARCLLFDKVFIISETITCIYVALFFISALKRQFFELWARFVRGILECTGNRHMASALGLP